jgi:hypothetical protein
MVILDKEALAVLSDLLPSTKEISVNASVDPATISPLHLEPGQRIGV